MRPARLGTLGKLLTPLFLSTGAVINDNRTIANIHGVRAPRALYAKTPLILVTA